MNFIVCHFSFFFALCEQPSESHKQISQADLIGESHRPVAKNRSPASGFSFFLATFLSVNFSVSQMNMNCANESLRMIYRSISLINLKRSFYRLNPFWLKVFEECSYVILRSKNFESQQKHFIKIL